MNYFDSHTHLNLPEYNNDREETIKRTKEENITLINVGTKLDTSKLAVELAIENDNMFATVGLHPTYDEDFDSDKYLELVKNDKVVAIGECGLDYFRIKSAKDGSTSGGKDDAEIKDLQEKIFKSQIKLAQENNLPLMIHCRPSPGSQDAYEDLIEILRSEIDELSNVVVHFFVGSVEIAKELLDIGCYFTFGGVITFARDYDDVINCIPLGNILLETDAPYVAPEPHRGKRNEPAFVKEVYKKMAELKNVELEKLIEMVRENNKKVFNI